MVDSVEVQAMSKVQEGPTPAAAEAKGGKVAPKEKLPSASCAQLFQFATLFDMILMFVGAVAAAFTGAALPLFIVFFAELLEEVGSFATGEALSFDKMWSSCRAMFLMGGGAHIGGFVYGWAFDLTKERQLVKLKKSYLKAIVRQDIGWFDVSNPQELPSLIGSTQADISASLGSATWQLFEHVGMAIAGFAVSLSYGWDVALVMVLTSPLIVASGALLGYVEKVSTAKISAAYATSGGIASEALSALRTVASLGLEPTISTRYESFLGRAEAASIKRSYLKGAADALLFASGNAMMGLGMLYAGYLVYLELVRSAISWRIPYNFYTETMPPEINASNITLCAKGCDPYNLNATMEPNFTFNAYGLPNGVQPCEQALRLTCATAEALITLNETDSSIGDIMFLRGYGGANENSTFAEYFYELNAPVSDFISFFADPTNYAPCGRTAVRTLCGIFGLVQGAQGLGFLGGPFSNLAKGRQSMHTVLKTVSRIPTINTFDESGTKPSSVMGAIEVSDVTFAYPSAPDKPICNGYTLKIDAGTVCTLCGPSGHGKSTIIQLVERFYDPQSGVVMLDGVDIKTFNLRWLRQQIGLVGQEPVLFVGTVADNIGYGKDGATQEDIEEAAKNANAHGFIKSDLPEGYATEVGQGGGKLSGGQKQRVAIARALIRKPSVLLLDEATSALDNESERIVQAALDEIMAKQKRTTIVIAHRLSTIRGSDKIAVVNKGAIVEEGNHDGLINLGGVYAGLVAAQEGGAPPGQ